VKRFAGSDDACPKKEHVMTAKTEEQDGPFDAERFRIELAHKLDRLVSDTMEGWRQCDNAECRRARSCASDGFECIAKLEKSQPPRSPEEIKAGVADLKLSLDVRRRLGENVTLEQFEEAIAKEKAARRAAMPPQAAEPPAPVVEETQLAPQKQARIDRAWNDYVKEQDRKREPGPRITQL
jgi:hypothetical protein